MGMSARFFHRLALLLALLAASPPDTRARAPHRPGHLRPFLSHAPSSAPQSTSRLLPPVQRRWGGLVLPGAPRSAVSEARAAQPMSSTLHAHSSVGTASGESHWAGRALEGTAGDGHNYNPAVGTTLSRAKKDTESRARYGRNTEVRTQQTRHKKPCPEDLSGYCLNGGTCIILEDLETKGCRCPPGYDGERCEYVYIPPVTPTP